LAEGKVYLGERAEWAAKNFFKESNLTALREMALRLVAEHVDRDLRDIMSEEKIVGPWKSSDRLLVAVSASPYSERLIRYTRRLAASMEASWIVANIEQPRVLSEKEQSRLTRYLALARQLGAEVISAPGTDIGEALLRIARQHNVTQIVIGKPLGSRWTSFLKRDPLRWLMRNSGNIDIHMIPADESAPAWRGETIEERLARAPWRDFGVALAIAAVVRSSNVFGDLAAFSRHLKHQKFVMGGSNFVVGDLPLIFAVRAGLLIRSLHGALFVCGEQL